MVMSESGDLDHTSDPQLLYNALCGKLRDRKAHFHCSPCTSTLINHHLSGNCEIIYNARFEISGKV